MKASISLSRNNHDKVVLRVEDMASHAEFLALEMTPEDFGYLVTGLSGIKVDMEVRGLEYVGKTRITERRTVEYTGEDTYRREVQEQWLIDNCQEEDWIVEPYLGSQRSVTRVDGKTFLNYTVRKYIETEQGENNA